MAGHKPIAREDDYDFLHSLLGADQPVTSCIVISGPPGSGKSLLIASVLDDLLQSSNMRSVKVSCLEACPTSTGVLNTSQNLVLFDLLLYHLKFRYCPTAELTTRCDNPSVFIERFTDLLLSISCKDEKKPANFCIVLHQAEKLRDSAADLLSIMVALNSLVAEHARIYHPSIFSSGFIPNVVSVLLTSCSWDKFYSGTFASEPTTLYLKSYTREQLAAILVHAAPTESPRYARFVELLLTVCFPVTRSVRELLYLAQFNWKAFDDPVASGKVAADDEWAQWRYALPTLKRSLSTIYLRPELSPAIPLAGPVIYADTTAAPSSSVLELPFYARFLLVAAYIASYNPRSADKRFLVKNTGKLTSRAKKQTKKTENVNIHMLGPRFFPLDRLLAIFYALFDLESDTDCQHKRRPPYTSLLASQVACLSGLGLIAAASITTAAGALSTRHGNAGLPGPYSNPDDPLANPRFRCLVSLETARAVAKSVNINLNAHLLDFI
uniref:Origin recognition complex subunit 5 n=1 Tax=Schistocephalus solidus TaxID=70667 RepID=A0A0X3PK18_SCHSO